ncbi:MAG: hypothetical protein ACD_62C00083G0013 [uncultured bacterium]|nr:MAG: hypothetical protein ACD_62C00083G0013 [uncultured bacterium]
MSTTHDNVVSKHKDGYAGNGTKPDFREDFKDLTNATNTIASDAVHLVQDNASQYYDKGMIQAKKFKVGIEHQIQKHPLQSLLIATGAGLLLGVLWHHR